MAQQRRRQQRGLDRQAALLRAAVEVAAEQGVAGITHRAVTEKAGLPLASASYFYSSIDELALDALRSFTAERADALAALVDELASESRSPRDVAALFASVAAPLHPLTTAQFEAYLHATRAPEAREAVAEAIAAFKRVAVAALRAAGVDDPDDATAATFVALADGLAMQQLALGVTEPAISEAAFRALFLGFLVMHGDLDGAASLAASQ